MLLPPQWRGFGKFIFAFGENYEPELTYLEKVLSPGGIFVDVGANMGIYTLVASKLVGDAGRVIAFEPCFESFSNLQQNIVLNGLSNVLALRLALTEKTCRAWLHHAPDPSGNSLGRHCSWDENGEEVATDTLDNALQRASVNRVDVIKLDVEGAEELVLQGANKTLISQRPIIIFEFNPVLAACLHLAPDGAGQRLESLGYKFLVLGSFATTTSARSQPSYFNVVAVPTQQEGASSLPVALGTEQDKLRAAP